MRRTRVVLALALCACGSGAPGVYRDQLVFVGGDGTVLALGLVRHTAGTGEAKGWLGVVGEWGTPVYDQFPIAPRRASDLAASARAWSTARRGSVRASVAEDARGVHVRLRTRVSRLALDGEAATALGTVRDPEGVSEYSVRRAHLRTAGTDRDGWLVSEHTPDGAPRRSFVDYGDFALVFAARPDGDVAIAKRAKGRRGYDFALVRHGATVTRTRSVRVEVESGRLVLGAGVDAIDMAIADREVSTGIAPGDRPVRYEVLLLGRGGDWSGLAFTIGAVRTRD